MTDLEKANKVIEIQYVNIQELEKQLARVKHKPKADGNIEPKHYTEMKISPLEYVEQNDIEYVIGNVIKYVSRYKMKNGLEDLLKAQWYLNHKIDMMRKAESK